MYCFYVMNYHELSRIFHEFIFILPTATNFQIQYTICINCINYINAS